MKTWPFGEVPATHHGPSDAGKMVYWIAAFGDGPSAAEAFEVLNVVAVAENAITATMAATMRNLFIPDSFYYFFLNVKTKYTIL